MRIQPERVYTPLPIFEVEGLLQTSLVFVPNKGYTDTHYSIAGGLWRQVVCIETSVRRTD